MMQQNIIDSESNTLDTMKKRNGTDGLKDNLDKNKRIPLSTTVLKQCNHWHECPDCSKMFESLNVIIIKEKEDTKYYRDAFNKSQEIVKEYEITATPKGKWVRKD
jgi:hypothetical protein